MRSTFRSALVASASMLAGVPAAQAIEDGLEEFFRPGFDYKGEVSRLHSEGYTLVELSAHDDDPRRDDIRRLFVAPAYRYGEPPPFRFGFHDFNGDGHDELVIGLSGGCDAAGCRIITFSTADGSSWSKISDVYGLKVAVPPSNSGDFPRITVLSPGFDHHYEFRNGAYQNVTHASSGLEIDGCMPILMAVGGC